jgi:hypothetical protein
MGGKGLAGDGEGVGGLVHVRGQAAGGGHTS